MGKEINGIIAYLGLQDFYKTLSKEEQKLLKKYYDSAYSVSMGGTPNKSTFIDTDIIFSGETRLGYFTSAVGCASNDNRFDFADKLISYGMQYVNDDVLDAHFFYQISAECYYKQKDIRDDAVDLCVEFCLKDINIFPKYITIVKSQIEKGQMKNMIQIITMKRLVMIYSKQKEYQKAIDICKTAIKYDIPDGTKGGFQSRLEKLEKKISSI